ncbi:polysaccharide biosynthesis C-terminal domain-containing protein [Lipingzhangella sp. LS1_29]|uniref:Polysaccharide biosynthesis C-terminal domain-containing protein n=1 Tax=Lipingzhangella rawalii TaxID=2055835 RepID=A0ABU2H3C9_9ACTN|nr:polysaccharide biosynthesis C-terminal domain-containing protein [Lipingzhangella rawalii]MDS1269804.1 polysaccharide biosynthesis C-terminal domain-containing protein [Lipingzhangella rawalii]
MAGPPAGLATVTERGPRGGGDGDGDTMGLRRVARGGALNLLGALVGAGVNLALVVVVTRGFAPEQAGVFFFATSLFIMLVAVANLGTSNAMVYFVTRMRAFGAGELVPRVLRLAVGPVVVITVALGLGLAVAAPSLAAALGEPTAGAYLRILALFLPCAVLLDTLLAATRGLHDMRATVVVEKVARPLAQLSLLAVAAATGAAGTLAVAWAGPYLPAAVVAALWLCWILRRQDQAPSAADSARAGVPGHSATGGTSAPRVDGRTFWGFALPRSVANVAQIGIQRSGIVLVALLRGAADAAVFTAVTRFVVAGQFASQAVQLAVQPRLTELLAVRDTAGTNTLYQASTAWLVALTWPLYLPVIVYAPVLMGLFGPDYPVGAVALVVVAVGMLLNAACGMSDLALTMTGRTGWNLVNNLGALLVNVALCVALVPVLGAVGAALAWVAGTLTRCVAALVQLWHWHELRPWGRGTVNAAAASCGWMGLVPLVGALVGGWAALVVSVLAGGLGYLVTVWRLRSSLGLRDVLRRHERERDPAPAA